MRYRRILNEKVLPANPGWRTRFLRIASDLNVSASDCVLDIGCGTGVFLREISTLVRGPCVGVDLSSEAVKMARKADKDGNTMYIIASITNLPLREDFFSKIICNHVIEHIHNYRDAVSEIARVLKKGGKLLIATPNKDMHFLWEVIVRWWIDPKAGHLWRFTYNELKCLLQEANLTVCKVTYYGHIFYFMKMALGRVLERTYALCACNEPYPDVLSANKVWHLLDAMDRHLSGSTLTCFSITAIK